MDWIHVILNLVGVLLWLSWRARSPNTSLRTSGVLLLSTLRRTETVSPMRWWFLGGLVAVLLGRSVAYWRLGGTVPWSPVVPLGPVTLAFRCDRLDRMLIFSLASFGLWLVKFYSCLLFLSVVNHGLEGDPWHLMVRRYLGWMDRWPAAARLLLPGLFMGLVWLGVGPLLAHWGWHPARSFSVTLQQALLVGLAAFLAWEYLIVAILGVYLVSSYVYLGKAPLWSFISAAARRMLSFVEWLPLRVAGADLAPVAGIALVLLVCEISARWMPALYRHLPGR